MPASYLVTSLRSRRMTAAGILLLLACGTIGCGGGEEGPTLTEQYEKAKRYSNPQTRGTKLVEVSRLQRKAGDFTGAEQSLAQANDALDEIEDPASQLGLLRRIAEAYADAGQTSQAKRSLRPVSTLAAKIENPTARIRAVLPVAETQGRALENTAVAEGLLKQCETWLTAIEDPRPRLESQLDLALAFHRLKSTDTGKQLAQMAWEAAAELENARDRTDMLVEAADKLHRMGQQTQASQALQQAEQAVGKISERLNKAHALVGLAAVQHRLGRTDQAVASLDRAETLAEQIPDPSMREGLMRKIAEQRR